MTSELRLRQMQDGLQRLASAIFVFGALACFGLTVLAATGVLPWLNLPATYGAQGLVDFGMYLQIGVTTMLMSLCLFIPSSLRVLKLEAKHREFAINMSDVARAYETAHQMDRDGAFELEREFDAVRERYRKLSDNPDFVNLSKDLLVVAAQMSTESRDLADALATEKVSRAQGIVKRRRAQIIDLEKATSQVMEDVSILRQDIEELDMNEEVIDRRLHRAMNEIADISAKLSIETAHPRAALQRGGAQVAAQPGNGVARLRVAASQPVPQGPRRTEH